MPPEDRPYKYYDEMEITLRDFNNDTHYKAKAFFIKYKDDDKCIVQFNGIVLTKLIKDVKLWQNLSPAT